MSKSHTFTPTIASFVDGSWLAHTWEAAEKFRNNPVKTSYIGRFAPSPSGFLHQGSLVAALASYVHAHWHGGLWLVRIEDVDHSRCTKAYGEMQLTILRELGFQFSSEVMWQSTRDAAYQAAFEQLQAQNRVYPCACTRSEIANAQFGDDGSGSTVYGGICRQGISEGKPIRSWRFRVDDEVIVWTDERGQSHRESLAQSVGDFVLKRVDGDWAYQLAVVVDDAAQGVTHVVRGSDLCDSTARQIALQYALKLPRPQYNHLPLLLTSNGDKLSKRDQAPALDVLKGVEALQHAWVFLGGHHFEAESIRDFWGRVLNDFQ